MSYSEAISSLTIEIQNDRKELARKEDVLQGLQWLSEKNRAHQLGGRNPSPPEPRVISAVPKDEGSLTKAVVEVLKKNSSAAMSTAEIHDDLIQAGRRFSGEYPRQRISNVLDQLVEVGTVIRAVTGRGRVPHKYQLVAGHDV